jgi:hypothetical protein
MGPRRRNATALRPGVLPVAISKFGSVSASPRRALHRNLSSMMRGNMAIVNEMEF